MNEEQKIDSESISFLGSSFYVNSIEIPPPTTATLTLLEIVSSPYVFGEMMEASLYDTEEALYIMANKKECLPLLADIKTGGKKTAFTNNVLDWSECLGNFDLIETSHKVQQALQWALSGFELLPGKASEADMIGVEGVSTGKKKESSTLNG